MAATERVTVTLPAEMIEGIDRLERNRSRFIAEAVAHELVRRRREQLQRSLLSPHAESAELEQSGLAEWVTALPDDADGLVNPSGGKAVHWVEGEGWVEETG